MNLKQITRSSKVQELSISNPTIIHFIPDFGKTTSEMIHNSGLRLSNCKGVVTKSRQLKLGGKTFNARKLYLDTKSKLGGNQADGIKTLRVFQTLPKDIGKNYYVIIDHSITSQAAQYITELTNSKRGIFFLFQQLNKEFKFLKSSFPKYENVIMFGFNGTATTDISILDLIKRLVAISPKDLNTNFKTFDRFVLTSINVQDSSSIIFPIMGINDKGNVQLYTSNLATISKYFRTADRTVGDEIKAIKTLKNSGDTSQSLTSDIVSQSKIDRKVKINNDNVVERLEVNQKQLSKILKKYKIRDKTVGDNIKASMDNYISTVGADANEEDAEQAVLKAIHLTIFGTPEIHEEYLDNPAKLISKLEEVNTYSKDIHIPTMREAHLVEPKDVIGLDRVTGLVRQEYEFSDNIHKNIKKLFKSLENRTDHPIKIISFKHDYQDNNLNRIINYEITLKNLAGGHSEPYTVNIKVPALVNDRYFKLNGKNYVMANQQYFVPVTKTAPNECRLLTPYATMTLDIVNMKFGTSEIEAIIRYIQSRYDPIIKTIEEDEGKISAITFKSGTTINLFESPYYIGQDEELHLNENNKLVVKKDGEEQDLSIGRSEFIYNKLIYEMQQINPDENLRRTAKSIPFIQAFISGIKLPLIQYMWQQLGLINALTKLGMDFKIGNATAKSTDFLFQLNDGKYLIVDITDKRNELIMNGLLSIDTRKFQFSKEDLSSKASIEPVIQAKSGTRAIYYLDNNTENMIDPVSKEILEFQDKPTNVIGLITDEMLDKLLNDTPDSLTDLRIYRSRQAEIMFHLMYKNLMMAHSEYKRNLTYGDEEAKLFLVDSYILDSLLGVHPHSRGSSVLDFAQPYNPVAELKAASKLIKTGPGGIPNMRSFKKEHRNIHPSYYGNIGPTATTEYAQVGIVNHMTLTPLISNQYGNYGVKDINKCDGWDLVSLDEGLVPFINELDASRAFLAYTHRAQASPIIGGEEPIVATGAEFFVPQLASNRFIQRAEQDGKIIEIKKDNYIKVEYKNGKTEFIDISPRLATTKRASYINLNMTPLEVGKKFKKNEPIAWTNSFNGDCYASGKNMKMAIMNYLGYSFEDGYAISEDIANAVQTEVIEEVTVIIPDDVKVSKLISDIGLETDPNQSLIEFSYTGDLDEYIDKYNILDDETSETDAAAFSLVKNKIKIASPGGEIVNIRIYLNNRDRIDPLVTELWSTLVKDLKSRQKKYSMGKTSKKDKLKATDNLDMSQLKIGTHKHRGIEFEGAKVCYFIKKVKTLNKGDKLSNRYGAKGVITEIIPTDKTPYGENSGNIDIFISPIGVQGRKNLAILKELYIGKIFYNLPRIIKMKLTDNRVTSKSIKDLILSIYELLDVSADKKLVKNIRNKFSNMSDVKLRKMLSSDSLKLNYIVEPFTNVKMEDIRTAAELLNLELDEYVFIPELETWTKNKVPVGIQYFNSLEQLATDYESLRSTGGYISSSGQPKKGKANLGGQSVGNLDLYNLLQYDSPAILEEFMTVRSDDFKSKRFVVTDIIQNGECNMPSETGDAATKNLYNIHMTAMGLDVG